MSSRPEQLESAARIESAGTDSAAPHELQSKLSLNSTTVDNLSRRTEIVQQLAASQPGCTPYENIREINVSGKLAGLPVIDFLRRYQPCVDESRWRSWIESGQITFAGRPVQALEIVRDGQQFIHRQPDTVEPKINPSIVILHEDNSIVIVNKPAPLATHPSGRFNRNSLNWILQQAYSEPELRAAHRLDSNTSGLVLMCRSRRSSSFIQPQFERGDVGKLYIARVHGHPDWTSKTCQATIETQPSDGGSRRVAKDCPGNSNSLTHFTVRRRLLDGTSLIQVQPLTGKTHQIRVHLAHLDYPIAGDPLYLPHGQIGTNQSLTVKCPPMCLHAYQLTFIHPDTNRPVTFRAPLPSWAKACEDVVAD